AELDTQLPTNPKLVLETRKRRRIILLSALGGAGAGAAAAWVLVAPAAVVAAVLAVLTVAGALERTRSTTALEGGDRNIEGIGTDPSSRDLKELLAQVKGMGRADEIRVIGPIARDEKDTAWTAVVQTPIPHKKVLAKHEEIAGKFDVAASQLRLTPIKTSEARTRIWCADEDPLTGPPVMSPLIGRTEPFDIWREPVFLGTSTYGAPVEFSPVNKAGMLTAGESGSGKSVADDQLLCAVALDPHAQMWLVDAKMVELEAYRDVAHEYLGRPDREAFKAMVQRLTDEKDRRLEAMARAGVNRITGDNWRRFKAPFILFHVDEIQMFTVGEKNGEVTEPLGRLASQCRAVGIYISVATQYPKNEVVNTFLRANLTVRLGLRCEGTTASNIALGDGMAGRGFNCSSFTPEQRGAAFLKGERGDPVQLRTGYLEKPDEGEQGEHHVRDIVKAAVELRARAGTLPTGDNRPEVRLLEAMIAIVEASGQRNLHTTEHLLPALAQRLPETEGWGPEDLAAALPENTRTSKNVRAFSDTEGREMSRPGYRLAELKAARERL
ncbi:FtsK/SpoIIIE domain-containing protein, partial [Nocardiopsis halophila]|uniref:FtsK/SpoIIIE domain-containing protein n=1 Tax=Nocardiopsis halophila TaxID=141692 RepID=UPI00037AFEB6